MVVGIFPPSLLNPYRLCRLPQEQSTINGRMEVRWYPFQLPNLENLILCRW